MFDPERRAELLRPRMMKDEKYFIAKITGRQESDPKKILDSFFRYKEYISPDGTEYEKRWLKAPLSEVWSPRFLGLSERFESKPLENVKKLEFQNPSYSGAFRKKNRKGDPRDYNKVFAVQVSGCSYACNYCYVPPEANAANPCFGKFFSAKEIADFFLSAKKKSKDPMNVVRITGGEAPTIIPEIIPDIYDKIEKIEGSYLWIDTNLSTPKYMERLEVELKEIMKKKNVGVVGCFKGVSKEDFSKITGTSPKYYERQFETAEMFLEWKTDFYAYLPALIYENGIENKTELFMRKLQEINKNLPLRLEMLIIKDYPGSLVNMQEKAKQGRPMPSTDQRIVFDLWYNKLLPKYYSKDMLEKFCCEVPI